MINASKVCVEGRFDLVAPLWLITLDKLKPHPSFPSFCLSFSFFIRIDIPFLSFAFTFLYFHLSLTPVTATATPSLPRYYTVPTVYAIPPTPSTLNTLHIHKSKPIPFFHSIICQYTIPKKDTPRCPADQLRTKKKTSIKRTPIDLLKSWPKSVTLVPLDL